MAALSVDKVYRFIQFVANKESRGWVSPEEFNLAAEVSQLTYYGELEKVYADTKDIAADLRPFKTKTVGLLDDDALNSRYPIVAYIRAADSTNPYKEIREVSESELPNIMNSTIVSPTESDPIIWYEQSGIQMICKVIPTDVTFDIVYLKFPSTPEWDYNVTNGRPVYRADGDTNDFDFDESAFLEISNRVLEFIGLNIGKEEMEKL